MGAILLTLKTSDTLRRTFVKWLTAARKSKNRRARLAEREHELRLEIIGAAWETWRDRFCENVLRDTVRSLLLGVDYVLSVRRNTESSSKTRPTFFSVHLLSGDHGAR